MTSRIKLAWIYTSISVTIAAYIVAIGAILRAFCGGPGWNAIIIAAVLTGVFVAAGLRRVLDLIPTPSLAERIATWTLLPVAILELPINLFDEWRERALWPQTLDEAADRLLSQLDADSRHRLLQDPPEFDWFGWGMGIRNDFGLWGGNDQLIRSCGVANEPIPADAACGVIIMRVIETLKATEGGHSDRPSIS